jgi:hypothetical protein
VNHHRGWIVYYGMGFIPKALLKMERIKSILNI